MRKFVQKSPAILLAAGPFVYGMFPYWPCLLAGAVLVAALCSAARAEKRIAVPVSLPALSLFAISAAYFLSVLWAVDRGMAFLGALKFMVPSLLVLLLAQGGQDRNRLLRTAAVSGAMTVPIWFLLGQIPSLKESVFIYGRFGGSFVYANAMGLYLIVCAVILCLEKPFRRPNLLYIAFCWAGVWMTGSRSLLVIGIVAVLALLIASRKTAVVTVAAGAAIALLITGAGLLASSGRALDLSFSSTEWLSRLAYYSDGVTLLIKHPFGMGHLGWWYVQPAVRSAIYEARYVHCAPLQLGLDTGVIPMLLFIGGAAVLFFRKGAGFRTRLLLGLVFGHALIDFDLEFLPIVFVVCLLIPAEKTVELRLNGAGRKIAALAGAALAAMTLYFTAASFLNFFGANREAAALYPAYTDSLEKLAAEGDESAADTLVDKNKYAYMAYGQKAALLAGRGAYAEAALMKSRELEINRLDGEGYGELLELVSLALRQAAAREDLGELRTLRELGLGVPERVDQARESLGPLAYRLKLTPALELGAEDRAFVEDLKGVD